MARELSEVQKVAARELAEGRLGAEEIAREAGVSLRTLNRWVRRSDFRAELARLASEAARETQAILLRYGPLAAARLVELLGSDKPDIARRTALDLVDRCLRAVDGGGGAEVAEEEEGEGDMEELGRRLRALASGFCESRED